MRALLCLLVACGNFNETKKESLGPEWTNVIAFVGAPSDPHACIDGWSTVRLAGLAEIVGGDPPECAQCVCSSPVGGACTTTIDLAWSSNDCSNATPCGQTTLPAAPNQCVPSPPYQCGSSELITRVALSATGSCVPLEQSPTMKKGPAFAQEKVVVCTRSIGPATPPEGFRRCILAPKEVACPASQFAERTIVFTRIKDDRACADCACASPTCPSATLSVYDTPGCSGAPVETEPVPSTTCIPAGTSSKPWSYKLTSSAPKSCDPTGGEPIGSASPFDPSTLCCVP